MRGLIHILCIFSLISLTWVGLPALSPVAYSLTLAEKEKNALQAQAVLAQCKQNPNDARQLLAQVKTGMVSNLSVGCADRTQLSSFLTQLQKVNQKLASKIEADKTKTEIDFTRSLRLQTLKNAVMTYVDAESRYNLNAPKPQSFHKTKTVVAQFCKNEDGKNSCSAEDVRALETTVADYRKEFQANKIKTYTPEETRVELNHKLSILNKAYQPSLKALSEWQKDRKTLRDTSEYGDWLKVHEKEKTFKAHDENYQKFEAQYLNETSDGVGILLYSKTMRDDPSLTVRGAMAIQNKKTVIDAVREVRNETLNLAHATNTQMQQEQRGAPFATIQQTRHGTLKKAYDLNHPGIDALKKMLKTNPVAAGQVLIDHPEFASEVCALSKEIESDDVTDKHIHAAVQYAGYGAMIVGGVCLAVGFLPAAGLVEGGATLAETTAVVEGASVGVRTYTTLSAVNSVLMPGSLVGATGYTIKRHSDLSEEISQNQRALFAKTGGSRQTLAEDEKESAELNHELLKTAIAIAAPLGIGKGLSLLRTIEGFEDLALIKQIDEVHALVLNNKAARNGLKVFDYLCGALGFQTCQIATSSLHSLPRAKEIEILSTPENIQKFLAEELASKGNEKKFSVAISDPSEDPAVKNPVKTGRVDRLKNLSSDAQGRATQDPSFVFLPKNPIFSQSKEVLELNTSKLFSPQHPQSKTPIYDYEIELANKSQLSVEEVVGVTRNFTPEHVDNGSTGVFKFKEGNEVNGDFNLINAYRKGMDKIELGKITANDILELRKNSLEIQTFQYRSRYNTVFPRFEWKNGTSVIEGEIPLDVQQRLKEYGASFRKTKRGDYEITYPVGDKTASLQKLSEKLNHLQSIHAPPEYIASVAVQDLLIIHPFDRANGRTARLLGQIIYKKMTGKTLLFPDSFHQEMNFSVTKLTDDLMPTAKTTPESGRKVETLSSWFYLQSHGKLPETIKVENYEKSQKDVPFGKFIASPSFGSAEDAKTFDRLPEAYKHSSEDFLYFGTGAKTESEAVTNAQRMFQYGRSTRGSANYNVNLHVDSKSFQQGPTGFMQTSKEFAVAKSFADKSKMDSPDAVHFVYIIDPKGAETLDVDRMLYDGEHTEESEVLFYDHINPNRIVGAVFYTQEKGGQPVYQRLILNPNYVKRVTNSEIKVVAPKEKFQEMSVDKTASLKSTEKNFQTEDQVNLEGVPQSLQASDPSKILLKPVVRYVIKKDAEGNGLRDDQGNILYQKIPAKQVLPDQNTAIGKYAAQLQKKGISVFLDNTELPKKKAGGYFLERQSVETENSVEVKKVIVLREDALNAKHSFVTQGHEAFHALSNVNENRREQTIYDGNLKTEGAARLKGTDEKSIYGNYLSLEELHTYTKALVNSATKDQSRLTNQKINNAMKNLLPEKIKIKTSSVIDEVHFEVGANDLKKVIVATSANMDFLKSAIIEKKAKISNIGRSVDITANGITFSTSLSKTTVEKWYQLEFQKKNLSPAERVKIETQQENLIEKQALGALQQILDKDNEIITHLNKATTIVEQGKKDGYLNSIDYYAFKEELSKLGTTVNTQRVGAGYIRTPASPPAPQKPWLQSPSN